MSQKQYIISQDNIKQQKMLQEESNISNIYDVVILGGGLSGLYNAYKLYQTQEQKYKRSKNSMYSTQELKVLIIESKKELGGRIHTYKDDIYGSVEAGAGRFNKKHKKLIELIYELNLEDKINYISSDVEYIPQPNTQEITNNLQNKIKNLTKKIIEKSKEQNIKVLQNLIFIEYIKKILTKEEVQLYYDSFGYTSEIVFMNAYDTIQLIKNHLILKEFMNLKGGLSQIIDELKTRLSKYKNLKIITNESVVNIENISKPKQLIQNNMFEISTIQTSQDHTKSKDQPKHTNQIQKSKQYYGKTCISTLNKETIENFPIFQKIQKYLKYIKNLPLCRIYSKFSPNKDTNEIWFKNKHKFTTNNDLRMVIPMSADKGTVMISYSDNIYAKKWNNMYNSEGIANVNKKLHQLIKTTTRNSKIPAPTNTKIFYWEYGVVYFGKGFDSTTMLEKIKHPYPNIPLYVCGENYSEKNNQWMEGALDTIPEPTKILDIIFEK